jgi:hypothetical protein
VGESYAGVYVPTLARELLHREASRGGGSAVARALKGLAVGDGCVGTQVRKWSCLSTAGGMAPHRWGTRLGVWTRPPAQADPLARGKKPGIDVAFPLLSLNAPS